MKKEESSATLGDFWASDYPWFPKPRKPIISILTISGYVILAVASIMIAWDGCRPGYCEWDYD